MPKQSMPNIQHQWARLLAGIAANKAELPHVEVFSTQLEAQLNDLKAELVRRERMQAEVRRSTRIIQESLRNGRGLASRISSYLKASYGLDSIKLLRFGLKPLRRSRPVRSVPALGKERVELPGIPPNR